MSQESPKHQRQTGSTVRAKRPVVDRETCPRCGRPNALVIGRSEAFPVLYLRCDGCQQTSVAPA